MRVAQIIIEEWRQHNTKNPLGVMCYRPPSHLAEKILNSRSGIEGERKLVTVLFTDLKGSMEMIADLDPEEAQRILDPVVSIMMEATHYFEGTVSMVAGDGIMAIFGAPVAHEDHAIRACYAALRIQKSAGKLTEEVRRSHDLDLHLRVGLNSGDVVVRSVGNDLHMDYSAVGHTTHLASRMEQIAASGAIYMPESTMRLVEGFVTFKPLGAKPVKGLEKPIDVYQVLGASTLQSRLQASVARGLTDFMGRDAELELIKQSLDRAGEGHGQIVALTGEAGIGKSRLIWEFTHAPHTDGWLLLEGSTPTFGKATSYGPIVGLLKSYLEINDTDKTDNLNQHVTEKILALDESLAPLLPGIFSLLDIEHDDSAWKASDPSSRRRMMLDGLKMIFLLESRKQPLLLVFDDLHWIDDETQELLDGLVGSLPAARVLLLVGCRPEYEHSWGRRSYVHEIRVDPMSASTSNELLETLLGGDPVLKPLKQLLISRTDGNPFFMEESVRTLVEMKFLDGESGAYRLLKAAETVRIPASAKAILSARIDRLSEEDKRVLQAAAVIGKEVPFALLNAITGTNEDALRESLTHLQSLEFLYETSLFPELKYTFRHALVQEVSYGSLLLERRRDLHALIVETNEHLDTEPTLDGLGRLAHHAFNGELWDKAVSYSRQAGKKALAGTVASESVGYFEAALKALQNLEQDHSTRELAIDLRFDMRKALVLLGQLERAVTVLRECRTLATDAGDQQRLGWTNCFATNLFWEMGQQDSAIEAGNKAVEIADLIGADDIRNATHRYLGRSYQAVGDYGRGIDLLAPENGKPTGELQPPNPSAILKQVFVLTCYTELGNFEKAMASGQEAIRQAEQLENPLTHSAALSALGRVHMRKGEFKRAAGLLEQALHISETANIALLYPFGAAPLGAAYVRLGDIDKGLTLLSQSVERATEMNRMVDFSLLHYWQSQAVLHSGDVATALEIAERGLEYSITYKEQGHQAWLLRVLGEVHWRMGEQHYEKADGFFKQSLDLASILEMRPLLARCQIGIATLCEKTGKRAEAETALSAAQKLCEGMGMTYWLDEIEAARVRI